MTALDALWLWVCAMTLGFACGAGLMFCIWALARLGLLLEERRR